MLIKPSIHLNGTSAADLFEGYLNAFNALSAAKVKLTATAPHGRDYYVQDGDAIGVAIDQHSERLRRIEEVMQEIGELATHAADHVKTQPLRRR